MEREAAAAKAVAAASAVIPAEIETTDSSIECGQRVYLKRNVASAELDGGRSASSSISSINSSTRENVPDLYTRLVTHDQCLLLNCTPGYDVSELTRENALKPFIAKGVLHRWYNGRECLLVCKDTKHVAATLLIPLLPANAFQVGPLSSTLPDIEYHMKGE